MAELSTDTIEKYLQKKLSTIQLFRENMAWMGSLTVQVRNHNTLACGFMLTDKSISAEDSEKRVNDEILPTLRALLVEYIRELKATDIKDPSAVIVIYGTDGSVINSSVIN